jgi:hypothetical protein
MSVIDPWRKIKNYNININNKLETAWKLQIFSSTIHYEELVREKIQTEYTITRRYGLLKR